MTTDGVEIRIHAPGARRVWLDIEGAADVPLVPGRDVWTGVLPAGTVYGVRVDRGPGDVSPSRVLVDPGATEVWFPAGHRRDAARPHGSAAPEPRAVAAELPGRRPQRRTERPLVVYEAHVRGLTRCRDRDDAGTLLAAIDELPRLRALGVSVLELLPVHQFDPDEGNYWGYMPLVFGAVHRLYAAGEHPADELADLVAAAHDLDIEVWLDIVVNHTTEEDEDGPVYNLRALDDANYYAHDDHGRYVNDAGTGNILDVTTAPSRRLVMAALERFADLGVDGFRFDLAAVLTREPGFVNDIGDWAAQRGVRLVAEPWDLRRYLLGGAFPDARWMQWNGRFRDDVRGFLRGEPGLVQMVMRRIEGSPDLFDTPMTSVNFLTAHDGFTMYDLVAYDHKHNLANGWDNGDGDDHNRSWNCGWEGDVGVPDAVMALRRRQLRTAMCLVLLSHGVPMFVAGDEFARTQGGNNNAYNQDNETSWIDWTRQADFADHERFVAGLIDLRQRHPILSSTDWWGDRVEWFGTTGSPDVSGHSRSLAWHVDGLYVMANMWWEPLEFAVRAPGPWRLAVDTADAVGIVDEHCLVDGVFEVAPRSIVVLTH